MIKKLFSVLFSLMLLAAFYVYAVLMEDESAHDSPQWMVEEVKPPLDPIETLVSGNSAQLARAMGVSVPLPESKTTGKVESAAYHGYTVHLLHAESGKLSIRGVRPLSAAPLIRTNDVRYLSSNEALLGYPVMIAQKNGHTLYYLATEDAAFEISVQAESKGEAAQLLSPLTLIKPD